MKNKINNSSQIIRRHGFGVFIKYVFRRFVQQLWGERYRRVFLFELSTPRPSPKSLRAAEGHVFRFATLEDIRKLHEESMWDSGIYAESMWDIGDVDVLALENGDRCLLQLDGEKLVGYAWLAKSSLVEIGLGFHFNMPNDAVYNYKGFTAPEYRGKGFQPLRHLKLLEHVKTTGQSRLFGYVDHLNLNSLRGVQKSGYRKIGVLRCIKRNQHVQFKLKVLDKNWSTARRT